VLSTKIERFAGYFSDEVPWYTGTTPIFYDTSTDCKRCKWVWLLFFLISTSHAAFYVIPVIYVSCT